MITVNEQKQANEMLSLLAQNGYKELNQAYGIKHKRLYSYRICSLMVKAERFIRNI